MSRRGQIRMTDTEIDEFLHGRHTLNIATYGPRGRIHLVAMWYGFFADGAIGFWTYGKSQKVLNLKRDPRVTCLAESGETYDRLKGVELVGRGVVLDAREDVMAIGASVFERYTGPVDERAKAGLAVMGAKRVAVRIEVEDIVSWDHSKLGGSY